jgi:HPt (histidine-containing phosphotransfer) domain-containing protein
VVNNIVYDEQDALERAGGDPGRARLFLDMLLESLPQAAHSLATALDRNDVDALQDNAHRLAGAASYCGAAALREAAKALETRACEGDLLWNASLTRNLLEQIVRFRALMTAADD